MNGKARQIKVAALLFAVVSMSGSAAAKIQPLLPPEPIEGEARAFQELIQAIPIADNPERLLRSLNLAREMTSGPTLLRAYIDCLRIDPLASSGDLSSARPTADDCVSGFPDHPLPRVLRGLVRVHSFDKPELLIAGSDDLISVFSEYPSSYQIISFTDLESTLRGLSAAGEKERKAALVKAYFNPVYVPSPSPSSNDALLAGIGELLESDEIALASRLASFLQKQSYVEGLLSFNLAKAIWPALEYRHAQGFDAAMKSWAAMENNTLKFDSDKVSLLSAMGLWDRLEQEAQSAITEWDGKDDSSDAVIAVGAAASSLWSAGLRKRSIGLSKALINKAKKDASGQISNVAFNAGYRMMEIGEDKDGRALIRRFITQIERDPSRVEWQSGNAFLNALRICALDGKPANEAMSRLQLATGDVYDQKSVAFGCKKDKVALAKLATERLTAGPMLGRLKLAIFLAENIENEENDLSSTMDSAMKIDPLKSKIEELFRQYPSEQ